MLTRSLGFAVTALFAIACTQSHADSTTEEARLIGGEYLGDGDLPSTLRIKDNCTAAKVGSHHILTAAHCVWKRGLEPRFVAGATIEVSAQAKQSATSAYQSYTVRVTNVAPEWTERCTGPESDCEHIGSDNENRAADVALIETVEEIANVPSAAIDLAPVTPGEAVIVTGYGCEGSVGGYWSYSRSNLRAGVVQALPPSSLLHRGSHVTEATLPVVAAHELVTPGPAWPTPGPGLCPGDSGGPLYRAQGGGATIVGVNSSYTFVSKVGSLGAGLPVTNLHARVDTATPRNIGGWLESLGANVCAGGTCPSRVIAPPLAAPPPAAAVVADLESDGRDISCQRAALDPSRVQAAIDEILATNAFCISLNGQRVALPENKYTYASSVWCSFAEPPSAELAAALPAAMEAKGLPGFRIRGASVDGQIRGPACDTLPTGDAACLATIPSLDKVTSDATFATGKRATCTVGLAQRYPDAYAAGFSCVYAEAPAPEYEPYLLHKMGSYPYGSAVYDAATKTVTGRVASAPCSAFAP